MGIFVGICPTARSMVGGLWNHVCFRLSFFLLRRREHLFDQHLRGALNCPSGIWILGDLGRDNGPFEDQGQLIGQHLRLFSGSPNAEILDAGKSASAAWPKLQLDVKYAKLEARYLRPVGG